MSYELLAGTRNFILERFCYRYKGSIKILNIEFPKEGLCYVSNLEGLMVPPPPLKRE